MNCDLYFVDTNVILYSYDEVHQFKRDRAEAWLQWLWQNTSGSLSWQVIQEFYWNAIRKFGVQPAIIRSHVRMFKEWNPPDVTIGLIERAWFWTDEAGIPFWDSMIVAAAERTRCRWLLSEDFQTGREFGALTVLNPFETVPA
jgi:predicted nucleic acid-binding protein